MGALPTRDWEAVNDPKSTTTTYNLIGREGFKFDDPRVGSIEDEKETMKTGATT